MISRHQQFSSTLEPFTNLDLSNKYRSMLKQGIVTISDRRDTPRPNKRGRPSNAEKFGQAPRPVSSGNNVKSAGKHAKAAAAVFGENPAFEAMSSIMGGGQHNFMALLEQYKACRHMVVKHNLRVTEDDEQEQSTVGYLSPEVEECIQHYEDMTVTFL
jgi:hypothetical protein